jgi:uncharacterized protein
MVSLQNESAQERLNNHEAGRHAPAARLSSFPVIDAKGVLVSAARLLVREAFRRYQSAFSKKLTLAFRGHDVNSDRSVQVKEHEAMTTEPGSLFLGKAEGPVEMPLRYANRHGLIAGATGTGKTVTLQILAEGFSAAGTCVFLADVKGDLSGLCVPGDPSGNLAGRAKAVGLPSLAARAFPCVFWDLFSEQGHPMRATVSEIGPLLLARLFDLNDTQEGVLHAAFALADDEGMLLLDLKDLRAILGFVGDNAKVLSKAYGNIAAASVGAVQRRLLMIEREGGDAFLGEPSLDIQDLLRQDHNGAGNIHILASDKLINRPRLYATFLLWLFSELFETLPEVGDLDQPKLVLFFDEAHLLFDGAPKALIDKVEQVVRLIRSK